MSESLDNLRLRFQGLPRAMQWAIYGAGAIALFLIWDSVVRPVAEDWRLEADRLQAKVDTVGSSRDLVRELRERSTADLVHAYGGVDVPRSEAQGANALLETVNAIMEAHRVKDPSFDQRSGGRLPKTALPGIARGKRMNRLQGDLRFEATTKDATSIIAALEASPEVEAITSINITKANTDWVKVRLSLEAWVFAGAGA